MPGKTRQQLQEEFEEGIDRLWTYYNREGHCKVHREHKEEDGYFLGRFVKNSLSKYKNGYLPDENIAKLEEFPGWQWSPKNSGQNRKINNLVKVLTSFHKEHGHVRVPPSLMIDGQSVMKTMTYFKGRYATGKSSKKEIEMLENIPGWSWGKPVTGYSLEKKWEDKFQKLVQYAMKHGHTFVPQLYEINGENLGRWVEVQRKQYATGKILSHRAKRLESLSLWKWKKDSYDDFFADGVHCLINYFEKYGVKMPSADIKTSYDTSLNEWINTQRKQYRLGNMPPERIRLLESIPGWGWTCKEQLWMDYYVKLKDFSSRFDHCDVPETYRIKGKNLRWWAMKVRREYFKGKLTDKQKKLLESLKAWQRFVEDSQLHQSSLAVSPTQEAIYSVLDEDPNMPLSEISEKSGYAVTTCSKYRKLYRQKKNKAD